MQYRIGVLDVLRDGHRQQRFDHAGYFAWQSTRLRSLVRHAYERVPFYRRYFDAAGLDPTAFRGREDLDRIPVVDRVDLQGLPLDQVVAQGIDPRRLIADQTSGSTGEPFVINCRPPGAEQNALPTCLVNGLGFHRHVRIYCLEEPETIARLLVEARPKIVVGLATSMISLRKTSQVEALGNLGVSGHVEPPRL